MLESLFSTVFKVSIEGGIIGLLILLIRAVVRHRPPKAFLMCLWAVMFIRLAMPFEISSPTSIYNLFQGEISIHPSSVHTSSLQTNSPNTRINPPEPTAPASNSSKMQVQISSKNYPIVDTLLKTVGNSLFQNVLAIVWISVAILIFLILSILYFVTHLSLRGVKLLKCPDEMEWVRRQGLSKRVSIYISERVRSPAVYGVYHAKIVFPANFDFSNSKGFHYILAHELQHVKGYDNLKSQLILLLLCFHWFNPIVWAAKILLTRDMEEACDQRVLKNLGSHNRKDYAMTLISMAKYERNLLAFVSGFGESAVKARVKSIMSFKKITVAGTVAAVVIVATVSTVFATGKLPGMQTSQSGILSNPSSSLTGAVDSNTSGSSSQSGDSTIRKGSGSNALSSSGNPSISEQNMSEKVIDYIINGQDGIPEAGKLKWSQTFLRQVDIESVYKQYLSSGGNADDVKSFAVYLTQNAPILSNWKELFQKDLYNMYGKTVSRLEPLQDDLYQAYVIIDGSEVPYVAVSSRTGYFHG